MPAERSTIYRLPAWVYSLKGRILGFFALFFLVSGWIMASYLFTALQQDVHTLLSRQQFSFVSQLVEEIEQKITLQRDALARVAHLVTPEMLESPQSLPGFLVNRTGVRGFFTGGLVVINHQGIGIAEFPALGRAGHAYAERDFFRDMMHLGQSVISEPYFSQILHEPVVTMIAPIFGYDGRVIAGLMGAIRLTQPNFLGQITEHKVGDSGGVYITSPKSRIIIVSTDKSRIFTPNPAAGQNQMLDRYMAGYEGSGITISSRGIEELTSGRIIPSTGWVLVARLPTDEAFQPIHQMKARLLLAMMIFAGVSLLSLWLILWRGLRPLAQATTDIQDMVAERKAFSPLKDEGHNEISTMLTAFNELQAKLIASKEELGRSQAALRKSEALYRHLFEGCKAVELLINPDDGRIVDANAAAATYYGWSRDTLRTMTISQINTLTPAAVAEEMRRARTEQRDHFRFQHRRASGDIREVDVWSGPIFVDDQELLYSIIIDVTERWRAEREVRRLLDFRRAILDAAGNAIIATDAQGIIRMFNPTAERWLGYSATDIVGQHTPVLFHDPRELAERTATLQTLLNASITSSFQALVAKTMATGQPDMNEWTYVRKDGQRFPVLLTVTTLLDETGQPNGFLGVAQDITLQKSLEQDLKRSNSDLEHFAYVASHDLRQPLRILSNYIGLLERRLKDHPDPKLHSYLSYVREGAQRMDAMIVDLLEYSRIGRNVVEPEQVSLAETLSIACNNLSDVIAGTNAAIQVDGTLPTIKGCPSDLVRLFQNLIDNALKFRVEDRPPHIHISASTDAVGTTLAIRDNGIGIDPKDQEHLFQIFQRLAAGTKYQGTGIGLASCRKIVDRLGGRIWVESHTNEGCTFFVAFPRSILEDSRS